MTNKKIWFITGAGRGMGVDFAKAALAAGHAVVASARDSERISKSLGKAKDLLAVKLDVTSRADAEAAVRAALDRFKRIDVLVNNAASFYAGCFEELTPEQMERQLAASLIGPMNVTRAVLPVMRQQRLGHIISISSSAGLSGFEFGTAYAASKFGLEGWMESLHAEIAPFGITTTIVNRGSSARSSSRSNQRSTPSCPSRTTTSAERSSSSFGKPRMASNPAILQSSRERLSPLRASSRRRAALLPVLMPLLRRSR